MQQKRIILSLGLGLLFCQLGNCQSFLCITHHPAVDNPHPILLDDYYYGDKRLDRSFVSIEYLSIMEIDTLNHKKCETTSILQIGKEWIKYQDKTKYLYDVGNKEDYEKTWKGDVGRSIRDAVFWPSFYDVYLVDLSSNLGVFSCRFGAEDYIIREKNPPINWHLTDSTRTIGSYECQLAQGSFGGRSWNAWFTCDIPLPYGPWKLHGLPGLILSAYDESGHYSFLATTISSEETPITLISYPYRQITRKQYNKTFRFMMEDYDTFINLHLSGSGIKQVGDKTTARGILKVQPMPFDLIERE